VSDVIVVWLEIDWDAPKAGTRALARYLRSVRGGDPCELAVAAGALSEEEAAARLLQLVEDDEDMAPRRAALPDIVVHAGGIPDDVPDHLRLPGPGERALDALRNELAYYVAITPVLNQAAWAWTFQPEPGFRHIVVDNASDDDTAKILADRGCDVFVNDRRLSRVENWRRCVEVFREHSDDAWMKWIFAGDHLAPGAAAVLDRAVAAFPSAKLIAGTYDWKRADGTVMPFQGLAESKLVHPGESLQRFALLGNWVGGPAAVAVHRDVLGEMEFGTQPWVADWQASLEIARRHPIAYVTEKVGFFDASRGRHHTAHEAEPYTVVQDVSMRYQALMHLKELAPSFDASEIEETLDTRVLSLIVDRIQRKQHAAEAPPATRVRLEGAGGGKGARARVGGRRKKSGRR
jgi:hypothetical protein